MSIFLHYIEVIAFLILQIQLHHMEKIFTNNSPFTVQDVNFSMFSGIIL